MSQTPGPTLADQIFARLSDRIVTGGLPAGARLRQDEIAAEFGASHVPVREAFRLLEAEGLVQSLPRRGVRVATIDRAQHFETTEMRAVLEGLALTHAFGHYGPGHLAALIAADQACSDAATATDWEEANRTFHRLLITPCAMPRLLQTIERLQMQASRFALALARNRPRALQRDDRDHKAILAALQRRDPDQAAALLTRHIRRGGLAA